MLGSAVAGYYLHTQSRIESMSKDLATSKVANQQYEETFSVLTAHATKMEKQNSELQENLKKSEKYNDELRNTLQKHNLTMLARKKPKLIEKRINDASRKILDTISSNTNF